MWSSALNVRCDVTSHRRGLQLWHYAYTFERSMHTNYAFVSNEGTLLVSQNHKLKRASFSVKYSGILH